MDSSNWRPAQGCNPLNGVDLNAPYPAAGGNWRAELQHDDRSRMVNMVLETLKEHMQVAQPEGLNELQRIAVRYENFIYTTADTKLDYLHKITWKMRRLEMGIQHPPEVIPNQNNPGQVIDGYGQT